MEFGKLKKIAKGGEGARIFYLDKGEAEKFFSV